MRLAWIDNLRALMIIFVVMIHAAVTYSGIGSWYYVENEHIGMTSTLFFALIQTFTQAYFMSLLYMISGYFTRKSLERKNTLKFSSGRLYRLGVPLLIYIFLLHPLNVKMVYPDLDLMNFYKTGILELRFFSWTGPLWFVEALLIFTIIYLLLRKIPLIKREISWAPTTCNILLLILFITALAFVTRLFFPIGTNVTNLQLGFFPAYIVMFFYGIIAHKQGLFTTMDYRKSARWLIVSLSVGFPAWLLIMFFGGPAKGEMLIAGGMRWPAFFYALWESFICVTLIFSLTGIFIRRFNTQNTFQHFLSDNAFGVFVFHAPVLIAISILLKGLVLPAVPKFILVFSLAVTASFLVSWLIRQIRPLRKIFT
ncbi:MAG: acyltransferase family protein [Bacteroidales bacterium]|nr:acyltransferase family protein [Lentimicrobiaceae bacterium]MDD5693975.1 acyltransferase family protein [Bacteroidales bacterium]